MYVCTRNIRSYISPLDTEDIARKKYIRPSDLQDAELSFNLCFSRSLQAMMLSLSFLAAGSMHANN